MTVDAFPLRYNHRLLFIHHKNWEISMRFRVLFNFKSFITKSSINCNICQVVMTFILF